MARKKPKTNKKNQNKKKLDDQIIDTLKPHENHYVPEGLLATALQLESGNEQKQLSKAINRLTKRKILKRNKQGAIKLKKGVLDKADRDNGKGDETDEFEGRFTSSRYGTGFVSISGFDKDVRIPRKKCGTALEGDLVKVRINPGYTSKMEGNIVDVVRRGKSFYVGTFIEEQEGVYMIEPDEKSARTAFFVAPENISGAAHMDKVIFELVQWSHPRSLPEARVKDILGQKGGNDASMLSILAEHQLKAPFPDQVEEEAEAIPEQIPEEEITRRNDIRNLNIFTIDPADAKDFDDGLSITMLNNGNYYLGVHIADVTYYITQNTELDQEARVRGTSVYLVDRVIPMLPEKLSNGVCSLRPDEDKLSYSCFMEVSPKGDVVDYSIEETVIRSKKRLTYEDAQAIIDGETESPLKPEMDMLAAMTGVLTDRRFREGSVDLDSPEPVFVLDENGRPLDVKIKPRLKAHRLIEECMLLANRTVAKNIKNLRGQSKQSGKEDYPFLYRVHDKPDIEKLQNVAENVRPVGIDFKVPKGNVTPQAINSLLEQVRETNLKHTVNELVLRSMAKAVYSPKNIGHFGLGFEHYAHFTSPIRRYPDVIVHRLLKNYAKSSKSYSYEELSILGDETSEREQTAVQAERDSIKLKQVEFISERIGETFEGVISGVTDKGLFIMIKEYYCEGMLAIRDLDDDFYVYDQQRHSLVGRRRGRIYQLGGTVYVRAVRTDFEQRTIDFELAK